MSKSALKVLQFTDTHLYGEPARSLRGVPTLPALLHTLDAAAAEIRDSDLIMVTGDLVQDDPAGYAPFRSAFASLGKPVLCIPGNHDDVPALRRALAAPPFLLGGVHDFGSWRLVMLDSSVPGEVAGRISSGELDVLEAALTGAGDERQVLVALHHHPVPMGSAWLDTVGLLNADEFFAVLDRHSNTRAVVFGHVHQAFEQARRGVRLFGTPSTCSQFRPRVDHFSVDERPPAWRSFRLYANGSIDTELNWLDSRQVADISA